MEQFLTEGAQRALTSATQLAGNCAADKVEPLHLLWALWLAESRAAEMMADHELTAEKLDSLCPLTAAGTKPNLPVQHAEETAIPQSSRTRSVIFEAQRKAAVLGRHAEVGSEHLLWGLATVDSPVAAILRQHGLDSETISNRVSETSGFSEEPIDVDFNISWQDRTETDHTDTLRIIDAAANRAREGLRVLEDFVRFMLDDARLTGLLKHCRHVLTQALMSVDQVGLLKARETRHDVGTGISTQAESLRTSPMDVLQANFKRVQEATRSLEEFGKILSPSLGDAIEKLRYQLYTLEKSVLLTRVNHRRFEGRRLYLLVTEALCDRGSGPAIREALAAGVGIVQVREKSMSDRELIEHGKRVRDWTRQAEALFIMNDRADLAMITEADGVHVGQDELTIREARRIVGPDRLVGVSTHTIQQARQAVLDGADYLGVGPMFPSKTKQFEQLAGLEFVAQVAQETRIPWFAIGGINIKNIQPVLDAGATRVAVSNAICSVADPGAAAKTLLQQIFCKRLSN